MEKLTLEGESETAAGVRPVPLRETDCGLPLALSVMEIVPLELPLLCGVNVMLIVQPAPPASEAGQLLVSAKGWFVTMPLMLRLAPPVFVRTTVCTVLVVPTTWPGNVKLDADSETAAGVSPVPLKETDCGLPLALSLMVTPPVELPLVCGVKVTLIEQLVPPGSEAGQLLVSAKG